MKDRPMKGKGLSKPKPRLKTPQTLSERVRAHYRTKFIEFPEAPVDTEGNTDVPQLPRDITSVTSQQLGQLHQRFKHYLDYVVGVLTLRDIDRLATANDVEETKAYQLLLQEGEKGNVKTKEARAFVDTVTTRKRAAALERKAQYVFLSNRIKALEGDLKLISREMTRRENEIERAKSSR